MFPPNLIPISGLNIPGGWREELAATAGGGAAAVLVGLGAVRGSSIGAGVL